MYFKINGINVNKSAHLTCFTVDVTRIGTPPTNKWRITMCGNLDVICPDIVYNQTYLPELNKPSTYSMSAAGYCKTVGTVINAKVEYFDGLEWIIDTESSENYIPEASRISIYAGFIFGLIILKSIASNASSKVFRKS